mmetsp:Transcript_22637/g.31945  ORF Transcript_22637/g.31945 Transcript_22637/m.31945 type:complete len:237 (+) Transcript_22637:124-834(+)
MKFYKGISTSSRLLISLLLIESSSATLPKNSLMKQEFQDRFTKSKYSTLKKIFEEGIGLAIDIREKSNEEKRLNEEKCLNESLVLEGLDVIEDLKLKVQDKMVAELNEDLSNCSGKTCKFDVDFAGEITDTFNSACVSNGGQYFEIELIRILCNGNDQFEGISFEIILMNVPDCIGMSCDPEALIDSFFEAIDGENIVDYYDDYYGDIECVVSSSSMIGVTLYLSSIIAIGSFFVL